MKDKICLVVHRYGEDVNGGAELLCRLYAKKLSAKYEVNVATTCAIDDTTWKNHYGAGIEYIGGIKVYRFPVVRERSFEKWNNIKQMISQPNSSYEEEIRFIQDMGPYSKELFYFIHENYSEYKVVIFFTYLYYTSAMCMMGIPNAILLPTAHDEPIIYFKHYRRLFRSAKGILFNTVEERELVYKIFGEIDVPTEICGVGIELPDENMIEDFSEKFNISQQYIVYAGRIAEGKGCKELVDFFLQYKKKNHNQLKLVMVGKKAMDIPECEDIILTGFVSDTEKNALIKRSEMLVLASRFESLSIVILEAMALKKPVLVTEQCPVLKGHIDRSGGGRYYKSYGEFEKALNEICFDLNLNKFLGANGKRYIENYYNWDLIIKRISNVIDKSVDKYKPVCNKLLSNSYLYSETENKFYPHFEINNIAIVYATDENYVPFMITSVTSIIEHSSAEFNYDIIIFSDRITPYSKSLIKSVLGKTPNFFVRFLDVTSELDKYNFQFTNVQLSRATFMRLLIPDLLNEYNKLIYLDCDTTINVDIAELYHFDLKDNIIAGVRDPHVKEVAFYREHVKEHLEVDLGITEPYDYFNAGVLVFNVDQLCKCYTTKELLNIATSKKWLWEDQDVLNLIAKNRVLWLEASWNVLWISDAAIQELMEINNDYLMSLQKPRIIHFAGGALPTSRPYERNSYEFWKYARKTPCYEVLLLKMIKNNAVNERIVISNERIIPYWECKFKGLLRHLKEDGVIKTMGIINNKILNKIFINRKR